MRVRIEVKREVKNTAVGKRTDVTYQEYSSSVRAFKQLRSDELPKSYTLESHETEDDTWFIKDGEVYNVNEFCTIGMPKLTGPNGGTQLASNGYFMIGVINGRIHSFNYKEVVKTA